MLDVIVSSSQPFKTQSAHTLCFIISIDKQTHIIEFHVVAKFTAVWSIMVRLESN